MNIKEILSKHLDYLSHKEDCECEFKYIPNQKTANELLFEKLGYSLHKQFLSGNLTEQLQNILKISSQSDLIIFEKYAREHNKLNIAEYIQSINNVNIV